MRIVCATCDAEYDVPDRLLPPGRATRCLRCGHQWIPQPVEAIAESPPELPAQPQTQPNPQPLPILVSAGPTAMDRLTAASAKPKVALGLRLAWVGTIVLLIGAGAGLYVERAAVVAMWPPSIRVYAVLGIAPAAESPHPAANHH